MQYLLNDDLTIIDGTDITDMDVPEWNLTTTSFHIINFKFLSTVNIVLNRLSNNSIKLLHIFRLLEEDVVPSSVDLNKFVDLIYQMKIEIFRLDQFPLSLFQINQWMWELSLIECNNVNLIFGDGLKTLELNNSNIGDDEIIKTLIPFIQNCPLLTNVNLSKTPIIRKRTLFGAAPYPFERRITSVGASALIQDCPQLVYLHLGGNSIETLRSSSSLSLESLNIKDNPITPQIIDSLLLLRSLTVGPIENTKSLCMKILDVLPYTKLEFVEVCSGFGPGGYEFEEELHRTIIISPYLKKFIRGSIVYHLNPVCTSVIDKLTHLIVAANRIYRTNTATGMTIPSNLIWSIMHSTEYRLY